MSDSAPAVNPSLKVAFVHSKATETGRNPFDGPGGNAVESELCK